MFLTKPYGLLTPGLKKIAENRAFKVPEETIDNAIDRFFVLHPLKSFCLADGLSYISIANLWVTFLQKEEREHERRTTHF